MLLSFVLAAAMANPSDCDICDDAQGAAFGLCNAYCCAIDCVADPAHPSCETLLDNYLDLTGEYPACEVFEVTVTATADDRLDLWIDGAPVSLPNGNAWSRSDAVTVELNPGWHTIAAKGTDVARVISGFRAEVDIDGTLAYATGDGSWTVYPTYPGAGWEQPGYPTAGWNTPSVCADASPWGTYWPTLLSGGPSKWVWDTANCRTLGQAWFRLDFEL
ncbi:MAG: hypothetical protein EP330_16445 [Deltaproteobacteria bacterium]|nr:MAG: hypothetical protein EP330_16445 [Deltaproteobacteria bacterium]